MKAHVFITGVEKIPSPLNREQNLHCQLISNPYELKGALQNCEGEKIIVAFLPFLEIRHFDMYTFLQRTTPQLKVFFVVKELSGPMKVRLKAQHDFIVLWKTEEQHLAKDIRAYLEGRQLELRQDRRTSHEKQPLVSPSLLPPGVENRGFQPILGGTFKNISPNGSCVEVRAPFYAKRDFINLTYQTLEGEYVSVEAQVRWARWNETKKVQELGVQFLTRAQ